MAAEPADRPQRLRRSSGAVERQRLVLDETLAEWMLLAQQFELADDLTVEPARQVGLDPIFDRVDTCIAETQTLEVGELVVGVVLEGRAAPEIESRPEFDSCCGRVARQQRAPFGGSALERLDVELAGIDVQPVAGADGFDHRLFAALAVGIERGPQAGDVHPKRIELAVALVSPQLLEHPVGRQDLAVVDEQEREHRLLSG